MGTGCPLRPPQGLPLPLAPAQALEPSEVQSARVEGEGPGQGVGRSRGGGSGRRVGEGRTGKTRCRTAPTDFCTRQPKAWYSSKGVFTARP